MTKHPQQQNQKHPTIRRATLMPVAVILGVILLGSLGCFYWLQQVHFTSLIKAKMESTPYLFTQFEEQEADLIAQFFSNFQGDQALIQAFRDGNRQGALDRVLPVSQRFSQKHNITHLYIHTLDKHCFLRAHRPEEYGGIINRWTLDEAARTGQIAYGLELGPLGRLTLRVVKPWRVGDETIGYLELGEEINHLLPMVKKALRVELVILVQKDRLDKAKWEQEIRLKNRKEQWSQLPDQVVIDSTLPLLPPELMQEIAATAHHKGHHVHIRPRGGSPFNGGCVALLDASGQEIGDIVVLMDFTALRVTMWESFFILALVVVASGICLFFFFTSRIVQLDKALGLAMLTLDDKAKHFHALFEESPFPQIEEDFSSVKAYLNELPCAGQRELLAYFTEHPEAKMEFVQRSVMKDCNNAMLEMLRSTRAELLQQDHRRRNFLPSTLDDFLKMVSDLALGAQSHTCESRLLTDKGEEIVVIVHAQVIAGFEETLGKVVVSFYDITERKRLEDEVKKTRNLKALGTLTGGIAHDFNNLFQALLGNIQLAKMSTPESSDTFQYLKNCELVYTQAAKLTNHLAVFSSGSLLSRVNVQPTSHIRETIMAELNNPSVSAEFDIADDLCLVNVDQAQFRQVIKYLTLNALEAMPSGGKIRVKANNESLSPEVAKVISLTAGSYIKISIQDQGCGISEENLPHIFDPYFSTKQRGSEKGMGFGLSLSEAIIRTHGGEITVESKLGAGTTIYIYLPAVVLTDSDTTVARI